MSGGTMSLRTTIPVLVAITLAGGASLLWLSQRDGPEPERPDTKPTIETPRKTTVPPPTPIPTHRHDKMPESIEKVLPEQRPPSSADIERRRRAIAAWRSHSTQFNQLLAQLETERDPAMRKNLIRSLAAYVRVDTLGAIEWATALGDADEQRAALEAIGHYALSGVGARLEADPSGYPRIAETTVLGAMAANGQAGSGDYIVGILDANGDAVSFKDLAMDKVVQRLRGKPGSEVQLLIKRNPTDPDSATITLPLQRSMIVVVPPE